MPLRYDSFLQGGGGAGGGGGDPYWDSVVLLAGFDGADGAASFSDESPSAHGAFSFVATAQLDTAQKKFDTASLLLDGNSDRVTLPSHADWFFGAGDFTIEAFIRFNSVAGNHIIASHYKSVGSERAWTFIFNGSTPQLNFNYSTNGSNNAAIVASWSPSVDTWYHVAVDRDASNDLRLYASGTGVLNTLNIGATVLYDAGATALLEIGSRDQSGPYLNGWADEVRITKGVARFAGTYVEPTEKFPRF